MTQSSVHHRECSLSLAVAILCALVGCSRDSKTYGQVSGRVTADDEPVAEAVVLFQEPSQHIFIQATTDNDGRYNFDKFPGGGLPVGSYQIAVQPPIQEIHTGEPLPPTKPFPKVDKKYFDPAKSGLELRVSPSENTLDIVLSRGSATR